MQSIDVVVETPKGSPQKFNYDPETRFFKLAKILPKGMVFPYDFGFIPNTKGEDGDPLDVLVMSEFNSFPGCLITCRIIGAIQAEQTERNKAKMRNDRFIAIPEISDIYKNVASVKELPDGIIQNLQDFFINYNSIAGKTFSPQKILTPKAAIKLIQEQRS